MKQSSQRNYNMSDAELCMFASNLVASMTRDILDFTPRGVTNLVIDAFKALGDAFELFPPDEYYLADVLLAQESKNAHRVSLESKMREITGIASVKWGASSYEVLRFKTTGITKLRDLEFVTVSRLCAKVAEEYLADLSPLGLTQLKIDSIFDEAELMEGDFNAISLKESARDAKTKERIEKGNELFALASRYCEIGKILYQDTNESKYRDYVIYIYTPDVPGKIQLLSFASPSQTFTWAAEPSATEYQLEFSPITPQLDWVEVYRGPMTTFVHPMGPGQTVYRCRGINENGPGGWSDNLVVTRI